MSGKGFKGGYPATITNRWVPRTQDNTSVDVSGDYQIPEPLDPALLARMFETRSVPFAKYSNAEWYPQFEPTILKFECHYRKHMEWYKRFLRTEDQKEVIEMRDWLCRHEGHKNGKECKGCSFGHDSGHPRSCGNQRAKQQRTS